MSHEHLKGQLTGDAIRRYVLAGNARFTVRNTATGGRFTYRVRANDSGAVHFVSVLRGEDNESDYSYIGFLRGGKFFHGGKKSHATAEAPCVIAFGWFWRKADQLPPSVECWHEGRCGRCGRTLTVPESIRDGIGPDCANRVGWHSNEADDEAETVRARINAQEDARERYKAALSASDDDGTLRSLAALLARFDAASPEHREAMLEDDDGTLRSLVAERAMQRAEAEGDRAATRRDEENKFRARLAMEAR